MPRKKRHSSSSTYPITPAAHRPESLLTLSEEGPALSFRALCEGRRGGRVVINVSKILRCLSLPFTGCAGRWEGVKAHGPNHQARRSALREQRDTLWKGLRVAQRLHRPRVRLRREVDP